MYTYTSHTHTYIHISSRRIYTHIHIHIHIYMHACMHTYMHIKRERGWRGLGKIERENERGGGREAEACTLVRVRACARANAFVRACASFRARAHAQARAGGRPLGAAAREHPPTVYARTRKPRRTRKRHVFNCFPCPYLFMVLCGPESRRSARASAF